MTALEAWPRPAPRAAPAPLFVPRRARAPSPEPPPRVAPPLRRKSALITGITGQDGKYLAELLLAKGYAVHGIVRASSSPAADPQLPFEDDPADGFSPLEPKVELHDGDLADASRLTAILARVRPDEVYLLGAQSHVRASFELAEYTAQVDAIGPLRMLEALRATGLAGSSRVYLASTSELFGNAKESPQNERTLYRPRNPYGVAKLFAHESVRSYREAHGMHASSGIHYNHESPRRGRSFVTRKISSGAAAVRLGLLDCLELGDLDSRRDWSHARDHVRGMWLALQEKEGGDYVFASGRARTVREFCAAAFAAAGIPLVFKGSGVDEIGVDAATGRVRVRVDKALYRPETGAVLVGDAAKAQVALGWSCETGFEEMVREMVERDLEELAKSGCGWASGP
ncbi:GDP-mannose 4,6 dehydratase [Hyaloraphidium curvatum]|nr:GDP-mannose 4,6 dehydratase [Hyaloraphidium curvatum]